MNDTLAYFLGQEQGQDVAEYAVLSAVVLAVMVVIIRLIGTHTNAVLSQVGSKLR